MSLECGIWRFCTVSLDVDFSMTSAVTRFLKTYFPTHLLAVVELGEHKKQHLHFVGHDPKSTRFDNLKKSLNTALAKNYDLNDKFSVRWDPCDNPSWRLGYLLKESDRDVVLNTFAESELFRFKEIYDENPKRDRSKKVPKSLTGEQVYALAMESGCRDSRSIRDMLGRLLDEGQITWTFLSKFPIKRFIAVCSRTFED